MNFDALLEEKFDKMIAIESLKHSLNIETTLNNLIASLKPNGILVIADDFLIKNSGEPVVESNESNVDLLARLHARVFCEAGSALARPNGSTHGPSAQPCHTSVVIGGGV